MEEKIKVELGDIQKTLLLPLWGRAKEAQKAKPILVDRAAVEVINRIDYDFSNLEVNLDEISQLGWIMRCVHIDNTVKRFLEEHPKATVVNIGCGLDTTYERVDNGALHWYDLDMPDTLELRTKIIPGKERSKYLAGSVFETSWFDKVEVEDNIFFIASGVFYFFEESKIRELFLKIVDRFPGSEIIFDASSPFGVRMANRMVIKRGGMDESSFLKWGLRRPKRIEQWDSRLKVLEAYSYFRNLEKGNIGLITKAKVLLWDILWLSYMVHLRFG